MLRGARDQLFLASGRGNLAVAAIYGLLASASTTAIYLHADYPLWRVIAPVALFAMMLCAQMLAIRRMERDPAGVGRSIAALHAFAQFYLMSVVAVTGGLHSPSLPAVGASIALPAVFFGRRKISRVLMATQLLLFLAMALLPQRWLGPTLPHGHQVAIAVTVFAWTVAMIYAFIARLQEATEHASAAVDELRDEQVAASADQLCRLQSVGAKVAHELKNPLASIKGLVQLVARSSDASRSRERLDVVQAEVARMEEILAEYLSFSRPLEDLKPQQIDLADIVNDVAAVVAGRIEHGGLSLKVESKKARLEADPKRLKEALLNLLANAIEATPSGGAIVIASEARMCGGARVIIRDSGRGISPTDLERLGTSFFTTREGGTGLGVVLAQNVIAQHGGTLRYASEVGRGTTATLELPARPPAEAAERADKRAAVPSTSTAMEPAA